MLSSVSSENRILSRWITVLLATSMALGLVWSAYYLETKWLISVIAGLAFVWLGVASGRFERYLLCAFFFAIPVNADFHWHFAEVSPGTEELGIAALDILLIFLYLIWLFRIMTDRRSQKLAWPPGAGFILGMIGWGTLSMINARQPFTSVFMLVGYFKAFLYFFYFSNNVRTREDLWLAARCIMAGLALECLIALVQYKAGSNLGLAVLGESKKAKELKMSASEVFRVGGTLGNPNYLGGYIASLLPLAFALNLAKLGRIMRVVFAGIFFLGMVVLVLTFSRSAWIGASLACGGLFATLVARGGIRLRPVPVFVTLLTIAALLGVCLPSIKARMVEDDHGSLVSRFAQYRTALSMIAAHPVIGIGLNNYDATKDLYESYVENSSERGKVNRVHDVFFLLASETGVIGLGWFLLFLSRVAWEGWKNIFKVKDELTYFILLGMTFGLFARVVHDAMHTTNLATNTVLWLFAAFAVSKRILEND